MRSSSPAEESREPIRNMHKLLHVSRFWIPTREIQHESWNPDSTLKRSELALEISCQSLCFFCVLIELFLEGVVEIMCTWQLIFPDLRGQLFPPNQTEPPLSELRTTTVLSPNVDLVQEMSMTSGLKNADQSMVLNLEPCSVWPGTFHQTTNALVQSHNHATELSSP